MSISVPNSKELTACNYPYCIISGESEIGTSPAIWKNESLTLSPFSLTVTKLPLSACIHEISFSHHWRCVFFLNYPLILRYKCIKIRLQLCLDSI